MRPQNNGSPSVAHGILQPITSPLNAVNSERFRPSLVSYAPIHPQAQQVLLQQQQQGIISPISHPLNQMNMNVIRPGLQTPNVFPVNPASLGFRRLLAEMKTKQFDSIRFAAYRTASKIRFIQQRTLFNMMDLWRVVETFREFGLHQLTDPNATLDYMSTFRLLSRIYSHIPITSKDPNIPDDQMNRTIDRNLISNATEMLLGWLGYALDLCATGRLNVTGLKIALSVLTNAKPAEKFRYHFTLLSDPSGALILSKFDAYLQDLLKLPISVFEGTNFFYTPQASQSMFTGKSKAIVLEEFLDRMLAEPGPQVLVWLTIFHRLLSVSNVRHNVRCEGCKRENIYGLRYKCTRCPHYNLCQDCFWIGITTDQHTNDHDVKEYSAASKSHSRQFGHSIRKSFQFGRSSSTNVPTSNMPGHLSERQRSSGANNLKRPHVGSIFEWNSDPVSTNSPAFSGNGLAGTAKNTSITLDSMNPCSPGIRYPVQRPEVPISSMRSPLPHRRLQQLNPLFMSAPANPQVYNNPMAQTSLMQRRFQPSDGQTLPMTFQPEIRSINPATSSKYIPEHGSTTQQTNVSAYQLEHESDAIIQSGLPSFTTNYPISTPSSQIYRTSTDSNSGNLSHLCEATSKMGPTTNSSTCQMETSQLMTMSTSFPTSQRITDSKGSEEHKLIARFAAQLAASSALNKEFEKYGDVVDSTQTQKQIIAQLQEKNRKILKEIERLRIEQQKQAAVIAAAGCGKHGNTEMGDQEIDEFSSLSDQYNKGDSTILGSGSSTENPKLVADLQALRYRKEELESRMTNLQRSRTELMVQLETLIRLLSVSTGFSNPRETQLSMALDLPVQSMQTPILNQYEQRDSSGLGHQSRWEQRVPEFPPRRSTSLCHSSLTRNYTETYRTSTDPMDKKLTEDNYKQGDLELDIKGPRTGDRTLITPDMLRRNLLSPPVTNSDRWNPRNSEVKKSLQQYGSMQSDKHSTDITMSRNSEVFLEKYKQLLRKGSSNQLGVPKSLRISGSRRQYSALSPIEDRTDTLDGASSGQTKSSNLHINSYSDSGSDAYLYSDPELGFSSAAAVTASVTQNEGHTSVRQQNHLNRTSLNMIENQNETGFTGTRTMYSDNYEYTGLSHPTIGETDRSVIKQTNGLLSPKMKSKQLI